MAKKKIKIKLTNIFLLIIVIYILVQIILWTIGYFTRTMVLDEEDINLQVKEKGLVVMNETLVKAEDNGIIKYDIDSDEKIQNNKLLFTISKSNVNEKINEKIEVLENEIKDLEQKEKNKSSNIILNKKEELKILKNQKQTYYTDYKAPISGVALFKYDKNFNISVDQLDDIDSKMLDSIENNFISIDKKDHKVSQDDVVLRLIDLNQVYICIFQEKNKEIFKEGQDVKVVVNDSKIDAKVEKIYDKKSEDVVAIKIMEQNAIIYNTRVQEFGIIYRKIQGFKIPIESVVEKNKKLGVYVIDEENKMPKFVNIGEDYYKDAKYYYVDYNKNKESLNLYDRILLYPNFINKNILFHNSHSRHKSANFSLHHLPRAFVLINFPPLSTSTHEGSPRTPNRLIHFLLKLSPFAPHTCVHANQFQY